MENYNEDSAFDPDIVIPGEEEEVEIPVVEGKVLYIEARKARLGVTPGTNNPFTKTIKDLSVGSNDVNLKYFNRTETDGYSKQPIISNIGTEKTFVNLLGQYGRFLVDSDSDGLADNLTSTGAVDFYVSGATQAFKTTGVNGEISIEATSTADNVIYVCTEIKAYTQNIRLVLNDGIDDTFANNGDGWDEYTFNFVSLRKKISSSNLIISVRDVRTWGWGQILVKNLHVFDLTTIFGAGNEPTHDQMDVIVREMIKKYGYVSSKILKIEYMDFLTSAGIGSYGIVKNDETFTFSKGNFAIGGVFITPKVLESGYIFSQSLESTREDMQFGLYISKLTSDGVLLLKVGDESIKLNPIELSATYARSICNIKPSTLYSFKIKRIDGVLKCELNDVEVYNELNDMDFNNKGDLVLFGRRFNKLGSKVSSPFKGHLGMLVMCGDEVDEKDFDDWFTDTISDYFPGVLIRKTVQKVNNMLGVGISIGNTLDSNNDVRDVYENLDPPSPLSKVAYHETKWGNPQISQQHINELKQKGFKLIRVPVSWWNNMDEDFNIEQAWLQRVKEVVDYIIDNDTYCVINVHHDPWLKADHVNMIEIGQNFVKVWNQIAEYFKNYSEHLIFEGYNEVLNVDKNWENAPADAYSTLNYFAQLFVNTVRATGSVNSTRYLYINTYASSTVEEVQGKLVLPVDSVKGRLMVQVHTYAQNLQSLSTVIRRLHLFYTSKGIPVTIGEFATPRNAGLTLQRRVEIARFMIGMCKKYKMNAIWWDDGNYNLQAGGISNYALYDRVAEQWAFEDIATAMVNTFNGVYDFSEILDLEPPATKALRLYRPMGIPNFCFPDPMGSSDSLHRPGDNNYTLFRKLDVSSLKNRNISLNTNQGSLFIAEFDVNGKSVYYTPKFISNNANIVLNESTKYIQFGSSWLNDSGMVTLNYNSDTNLIYI